MYVRAVPCPYRRHLEADDEEALHVMVRDHLTRDHTSMRPTNEQVTEIGRRRSDTTGRISTRYVKTAHYRYLPRRTRTAD